MADLRPVYVAGDGDVKGPVSSSNNFLPLFADVSGKLLKSSGTGVTAQGLAILDDNTPAEQRNTIGLSQVNNTSDINKPLSTAQALALQVSAQNYSVDTGVANAYVCKFSPAIVAREESAMLKFKVTQTNNGPCTINDGLGAVPLVGMTYSALQGRELVTGGYAWVQWNTSIGAYILLFCTGGALQVGGATKSKHAIPLGQEPTETLGGAALVATQALVDAGTDDTTVVTPKKLRFGISMSLGVNGYVALPSWLGGVIFQWGKWSIAGGATATSIPMNIGFPKTAFYLAPQWNQSAQIRTTVTFMGSFNEGRTAYDMWTNQAAGSYWILWFAVGN